MKSYDEIKKAKDLLEEKSKILYELNNQDKIPDDLKGIIDCLDTALNILSWCTDEDIKLEDVYLVGRFDDWKIKEIDSIINIYER